jgi:hypothetical protein
VAVRGSQLWSGVAQAFVTSEVVRESLNQRQGQGHVHVLVSSDSPDLGTLIDLLTLVRLAGFTEVTIELEDEPPPPAEAQP